MKKKLLLLLCMAAVLCMAAGCSFKFRSVNELFTLPKLPEEYQNLQSMIEEVTKTGAEFSAPTTGSNTQPVQLQDLDGDGKLEAIAFFKVSGSEKPLKIYIYHLSESGYEVATVIESEGTGIFSIAYEDLNGSPDDQKSGERKDLIVSWSMSGSPSLEVYALDSTSQSAQPGDGQGSVRYEVNKLLSTSYTNFQVMDIDMDNRKELLVLTLDTVEGNKSRLECYDAEKGSLVMVAAAPMSLGITGLESVKSNGNSSNCYLKGETPIPALFVTSYYFEGVITDIFAWKDGTLKNITLDSESSVSMSTYRVKDKASLTDINDDSFMEIPMPLSLPNSDPAAAADATVLYTWYQYDLDGNAHMVYTTYQNFSDGWYFTFPDEWVGQVTVSQSYAAGELSTVFSLYTGFGEPKPFLTIYKLTGPNRYSRSQLGDRFTLRSSEAGDTTIYAAEFTRNSWDCGLDEAAVAEHFKMSKSDWSVGAQSTS